MSGNIGAPEDEEALRNSGYIVYRDGLRPPSKPVDLDDYPAVVGDFGGDAEDAAEDHADDNDMGYTRPTGDRNDIRENTVLVTAAFDAAGDPRFQDVRLKVVRTAWAHDPTLREIARRRSAQSLPLPFD
jgi:hypothetical protein